MTQGYGPDHGQQGQWGQGGQNPPPPAPQWGQPGQPSPTPQPQWGQPSPRPAARLPVPAAVGPCLTGAGTGAATPESVLPGRRRGLEQLRRARCRGAVPAREPHQVDVLRSARGGRGPPDRQCDHLRHRFRRWCRRVHGRARHGQPLRHPGPARQRPGVPRGPDPRGDGDPPGLRASAADRCDRRDRHHGPRCHRLLDHLRDLTR